MKKIPPMKNVEVADGMKKAIKDVVDNSPPDITVQRHVCWICRKRHIYIAGLPQVMAMNKYMTCSEAHRDKLKEMLRNGKFKVPPGKTVVVQEQPCYICGKKMVYVAGLREFGDLKKILLCSAYCTEKFKAKARKDQIPRSEFTGKYNTCPFCGVECSIHVPCPSSKGQWTHRDNCAPCQNDKCPSNKGFVSPIAPPAAPPPPSEGATPDAKKAI